MATNNQINNSLPNGVTASTASEAININTTGAGTTTIGNSSGGSLTFNSNGSLDGFFINNNDFNLNTSTGGVNIGSTSSTGIISIGSSGTTLSCTSVSSGGSIIFSSGSSSTDATLTDTGTTSIGISGGATTNFESTSDLKFACNNTGAITCNAPTTNVGNSSISSAMNLNSGTGALNIGSTVAKTTTIGNSTGASAITVSCGTGGINYPSGNYTIGGGTFVPGIYSVANSGSLITFTLPTTVTIGTIFRAIGNNSGGWKIAQNSGQTIYSTTNNTTTGATGSLASTNQRDCVELVCTTANNDFVILNSQGTLTFA